MRYRLCSVFCLVALLPQVALSVISLNGTTGWVAIEYDTPSDYLFDQQTGQPEADLVGQPEHSSFYKAYDPGSVAGDISDDFIGFRFRVRSDENPAGFSKYGFVGIDADSNGSIDAFVGGNESGINYYSPGDDLNVSPNTTSVANLTSADTYMGNVVDWSAGSGTGVVDFSAVSSVDPTLNLNDPAYFSQLDPSDANYVADTTTADLDGGLEEDYFFSFQVSMATLMKAIYVSTSQNTNKDPVELGLASAMTFIVVTSTQDNSFNQDLNGQDGNALNYNKSGATWQELGADSNSYTADGESPVPEFSAYTIISGLFALVFVAAGRRR